MGKWVRYRESLSDMNSWTPSKVGLGAKMKAGAGAGKHAQPRFIRLSFLILLSTVYIQLCILKGYKSIPIQSLPVTPFSLLNLIKFNNSSALPLVIHFHSYLEPYLI